MIYILLSRRFIFIVFIRIFVKFIRINIANGNKSRCRRVSPLRDLIADNNLSIVIASIRQNCSSCHLYTAGQRAFHICTQVYIATSNQKDGYIHFVLAAFPIHPTHHYSFTNLCVNVPQYFVAFIVCFRSQVFM